MALYAFDGTNQRLPRKGGHPGGKATPTNVGRFYQAYVGAEDARASWKVDHRKRGSIHLDGPGWSYVWGRFPLPPTYLLGILFGAGAALRLRRAYWRLCHNYHERNDKTIDIVGFSRGAALAIAFANVIDCYGVHDPADRRPMRFRWHKYLGLVRGLPEEQSEEESDIRFIGLFDVVGSFGIAVNLFGIDFQAINLGLKLGLPPKIASRCYHAMALDETRRTFRPTRVKKANEVWFRGVHSNVGGGLLERGLSDLALRWMFDRAVDNGVELKKEVIDLRTELGGSNGYSTGEFSVAKNFEFMRGWFREVRPGELVHWTAYDRASLGDEDRRKRGGREVSKLAPIPYNAVPLRDDAHSVAQIDEVPNAARHSSVGDNLSSQK